MARPSMPSDGRVVHDANRDRRWLWQHRAAIPSDATAAKQLLDALLEQLRAADWQQHDVFGVHLAMEEALMNAIRHGNQYDANKRVHVDCRLGEDLLWVEIADEGAGFDLAAVPDCTDPERLEVCSGRGLLLMRSFMSRVAFNDVGNCVTLEKVRVKAQ